MIVLSKIQQQGESAQLPALLKSSVYSPKAQLHEDAHRLKTNSQRMNIQTHEVWAVINEVLAELKDL